MTAKEALDIIKRSIQNLEYNDILDQEALLTISKVITEQEKKDKLLKLYHDFNYGDYDAETDRDMCKQIKILEEDLK